ncbi:MAG: polyphosphate polymerase domain-containing protein [Actinomycetia bacterium]|nr:polyphosphate polymerase domain-containing protein [Actinomycetes bacterium]
MHSPDPDPFVGLETVSLEELNTRAALQTRVDRKYLLARCDLATLFDDLETMVRVLEIDGDRRFAYESTYFDTPTLDSYLDAARSRPNRFKIRTRTYLDSDQHFLEVKTRSRGGDTIKTRRSATTTDHCSLTPTSRAFVTETLADELPTRSQLSLGEGVAALHPTIRTYYRRTTLLVEPNTTEQGLTATPSRATIDTSLGFAAPGQMTRFHRELAVIETKSTGRPSPIDRLLWRARYRPVKVSKYGVGLALEHPHLPASKWNRILRLHFSWRPDRSR